MQALDDIIQSIKEGLFTDDDKRFIRDHADEVRETFPEGIIPVLRSIYSVALPIGGINRLRDEARALQLSLSLFQERLRLLDSDLLTPSNFMNEREYITLSMAETRTVLEEKERAIQSYEDHEARLRAIKHIQDYLKSL